MVDFSYQEHLEIPLTTVSKTETLEITDTEVDIEFEAFGGTAPYEWMIVRGPFAGTVILDTEMPDITYTPRTDFVGRDFIEFRVFDAYSDFTPGVVYIRVKKEPDDDIIDRFRRDIADNVSPYAFSNDDIIAHYIEATETSAGPRTTFIKAKLIAVTRLMTDASKRADYKQFELQEDLSDVFGNIQKLKRELEDELEIAMDEEMFYETSGGPASVDKTLTLPTSPRRDPWTTYRNPY